MKGKHTSAPCLQALAHTSTATVLLSDSTAQLLQPPLNYLHPPSRGERDPQVAAALPAACPLCPAPSSVGDVSRIDDFCVEFSLTLQRLKPEIKSSSHAMVTS